MSGEIAHKACKPSYGIAVDIARLMQLEMEIVKCDPNCRRRRANQRKAQ